MEEPIEQPTEETEEKELEGSVRPLDDPPSGGNGGGTGY